MVLSVSEEEKEELLFLFKINQFANQNGILLLQIGKEKEKKIILKAIILMNSLWWDCTR